MARAAWLLCTTSVWGAFAVDDAPLTLSNGLVIAAIDPRAGLLSLADTAGQASSRSLRISNDTWAVDVAACVAPMSEDPYAMSSTR